MAKIFKTSILIAFFTSSIVLLSFVAHAREGMTVSLLGIGNILLIDTDPELDPGPGGGIAFDYRFNNRFSIETTILVTTHAGKTNNADDGSIEFLGIPTADLKYYFIGREDWAFDPYVGLGVGAYAISEGSTENDTNGVGLGSQLSVGVDYYISDKFSVGCAGVFRSIAIIKGTDNDRDNATALLPYSLVAKVGFHF